jgi:hypothetical protein
LANYLEGLNKTIQNLCQDILTASDRDNSSNILANFLEGLNKTIQNLCQDILCPGPQFEPRTYQADDDDDNDDNDAWCGNIKESP